MALHRFWGIAVTTDLQSFRNSEMRTALRELEILDSQPHTSEYVGFIHDSNSLLEIAPSLFGHYRDALPIAPRWGASHDERSACLQCQRALGRER